MICTRSIILSHLTITVFKFIYKAPTGTSSHLTTVVSPSITHIRSVLLQEYCHLTTMVSHSDTLPDKDQYPPLLPRFFLKQAQPHASNYFPFESYSNADDENDNKTIFISFVKN